MPASMPRAADISSTPKAMLASIFRANSIIDLFAPKRAVNHDRLVANSDFDLFQQLSQALEICNFTRVRFILKLSVVGYG